LPWIISALKILWPERVAGFVEFVACRRICRPNPKWQARTANSNPYPLDLIESMPMVPVTLLMIAGSLGDTSGAGFG
jgi:hypothetical protein